MTTAVFYLSHNVLKCDQISYSYMFQKLTGISTNAFSWFMLTFDKGKTFMNGSKRTKIDLVI